jgi:hypothetical protein
MKAKLLLRLAAACIVIHFLGHLAGHVKRKETTDPVKQEVIRQMTEHKFEFMGTTRSIDQYYEGFSLLLFVVFALLIHLLWISSDLTEKQTSIAQKIARPIASTLLLFSIIEFIYFFPFAASISLVASIFTWLAIAKLSKE